MDILYVSQYFPPEMGAPAARAAELSYHWVSAGHQVTVLTGFPNHPTGTIPENYRAPLRRLVFHETVHGVNVVRSWLLPFPNRKSWERMLNYSSFCVSSALTGLQIPRPDLVIGSSPQLLVALSAYWIARLKRVPFIFEVRDLWPESLSAVGVGGENSLLHRLLRGIASYLYSRADQVVVVTPAFKQFLAEKYQVPIDKISIIPNGVETAHFSPEMKDEFLHRRLGIKSEFTVCYIGTLGMAHGLETLIEAARRLQATHPQITFLIVGEGSEKQHLMNLANSLRLKNVRFVDQQPRELVPQFVNASDAAAVLLKKSEVFKTVIPTKMLEFMSCARPLIAGVEGQAQELLQDAHAGICFEPGNVLALVDAILTLFSQPSLRESCGRNGRRYIIQNLSRKQTAFDYVNVLQNVLFPVSAKSRAA
jgi:colanic acid biosynthesis glycosyl transferase WcaI